MSPMARRPLRMEHALLGFLYRRPNHGYGIFQELSDPQGLGLVWRLKQSRLYALLNKLQEAGYVTATIEHQEARPPRKVYSLTPEGTEAFMAWLQTPVDHGRRLRLEFLAKLYFARRQGKSKAIDLIEAQRSTCREWLAEQRRRARTAQEQPYDWLVHQFRVGQIEAMLDWLDTCARRIQESQS